MAKNRAALQPFGTRLQLLARLTLNAGKHPGDQPTRLAHLDDGNHCAILVQGDEGPAQVVRLGHQGTPSVRCSDDGAISSPPAPYHLAAGGGWIRTLGPPLRGTPSNSLRKCARKAYTTRLYERTRSLILRG